MFFLLSILRSPMDFCVVELLMYFVHNGIFHMISRYDIHRQRENTHIFLIQHLGAIGKQRTWVFIHVHLDSLLCMCRLGVRPSIRRFYIFSFPPRTLSTLSTKFFFLHKRQPIIPIFHILVTHHGRIIQNVKS